MKKDAALKLRQKAREIAEKYSHERPFNYDHDEFEVFQIIALSEDVAYIKFYKTSTKYADALLFYIVTGTGGYWQYFFPKDSHVLGMQMFAAHIWATEIANFPKNFPDAVKIALRRMIDHDLEVESQLKNVEALSDDLPF